MKITTNNLGLATRDLNDYGTTLVREVLEENINSTNGNMKKVDDVVGGTPASLTTTAKTIVPAINELDTNMGDLSTLTTTSKTDLVGSNNEINGKIGMLANLPTTDKSNVVASITELNTKKSNVSDVNSLSNVVSSNTSAIQLKANQSDLNTTNTNLSNLQNTVSSNYSTLDTKINSQASGSPKGVYTTLSALTTAIPSGNSNIYVVSSDGNWYYWNGTAWTSGGTYQSTGILNGSIGEEKLSFIPVNGVKSKNLFNKATVTTGYYIEYQNGALVSNTDFSASDYISVQPNTSYRVSGCNGEQGAFYDINKNYISGLAFMGDLTTTPANCYYIRLSVKNSTLSVAQIEKGTSITSYEPYGNKISATQIMGLSEINTNEITVDLNGTGNYLNLSSAITNITDSSYYNRYNITILSGTYDVYSNLTTSELSGNGITLPDYVDLVGVGNVVLKGEIPDASATLDNTSRIATLNLNKNNKLKNLTVTAKNMRYPVHDESNGVIKNWMRNCEDCKFIHHGNKSGTWLYTNGWGEGCSSGSKSYFKNCKFISYTTNPAYSTHNNVNFTNGSYHEFENCDFINLSSGGVAIRLGSMGSGVVDNILIKGCKFTGCISIIEEQGNGVGIDFTINGYGNQKLLYSFAYTNANNFKKALCFSDEVSNSINVSGTSISAKSVVKLSGVNQITTMQSTDSQTLFYGIALEDIANGSYGKVRNCGYIKIADTNLSSASVGDKIGIVNGVLSVVTGSDYIGVCDISGYIRLLYK